MCDFLVTRPIAHGMGDDAWWPHVSLSTILKKYRDQKTSPRDQGSRFEDLIKAYLDSDPQYSPYVQEVYLWNDFPYKDQFGSGTDIGIDVVVETNNNEFCAVQCKCRQATARIDKSEVDTFLATSGRTFANKLGLSIAFKNSHQSYMRVLGPQSHCR